MALTSLSIRYLGDNPFVLDLRLGPDREIQKTFTTGDSLDISRIATQNELERDITFASLVSRGLFTITAGANSPSGDAGGSLSGSYPDPALAESSVSSATIGFESSYTGGVPIIFQVFMPDNETGLADDIDVFDGGSAPYGMHVVNSWAIVTSSVGGTESFQLRTAASGGGQAASVNYDGASAGVLANVGSGQTASRSIESGEHLYVRRTNDQITGEFFIQFLKKAPS